MRAIRWAMLGLAVAGTLAASAQGAELRLNGFAMNLPGAELDDAVWIQNRGTTDADLSNATISDNTGTIQFPPGAVLAAGATVVVAGDADSYREATHAMPDFAIRGLDAAHAMLQAKANFALSQSGDRLSLSDGGDRIDVVVYGDASSVSGWIGPPVGLAGGTELRWFPRIGAVDHDSREDWESPVRFYAGQVRIMPTTWTVTRPILAYTAPERSRAVLEGVLDGAQSSLRINVYQFRDLGIADQLVRLRHERPWLNVSVLLDATPVGEDARELSLRGHVIQRLEGAGAHVRLMTHDRYAFDHAKYVVADDHLALVQSENFVDSGIPADAQTGNRGWGVVIDDAEVAARLGGIFDADFAPDAHGARDPVASDAPKFPPPVTAPIGAHPGRDLATSAGPANVTLLASPFVPGGPGDPILAAIHSASQSLRVEQLNLPIRWKGAGVSIPNAYLDALKAAAARGVDVQILLDGHFLSDDESPDDGDTVDNVNSGGAGPNIEARLMTGSDRPVLHVKGLIVDGRAALVGSMNWNLNSLAQNREVDLLVNDTTLAQYFGAAFQDDWTQAAAQKATPGLGWDATVITVALLCVALRMRGRPE